MYLHVNSTNYGFKKQFLRCWLAPQSCVIVAVISKLETSKLALSYDVFLVWIIRQVLTEITIIDRCCSNRQTGNFRSYAFLVCTLNPGLLTSCFMLRFLDPYFRANGIENWHLMSKWNYSINLLKYSIFNTLDTTISDSFAVTNSANKPQGV